MSLRSNETLGPQDLGQFIVFTNKLGFCWTSSIEFLFCWRNNRPNYKFRYCTSVALGFLVDCKYSIKIPHDILGIVCTLLLGIILSGFHEIQKRHKSKPITLIWLLHMNWKKWNCCLSLLWCPCLHKNMPFLTNEFILYFCSMWLDFKSSTCHVTVCCFPFTILCATHGSYRLTKYPISSMSIQIVL